NKKRIAAESKARQAHEAAERADAEALASRIGAVALSVSAKAGEDGKLFGSVTSADIAEMLGQHGLEIDKRKIELEHPIKELGDHIVPIRLPHDVHAEARLTVTAEE